jgi:hypothetical protein
VAMRLHRADGASFRYASRILAEVLQHPGLSQLLESWTKVNYDHTKTGPKNNGIPVSSVQAPPYLAIRSD